jgi:predicted Zn-dependent protease
VIGGWLTIVVLALYAKRGPFWRVDAGTLFERAVEATGQGNDQEAFGLLNQAIGRDSTQAGFLIAKGFTALRLDRPDTASRSFERALRHEPANPEATLGLAASLIRLNHLDSARTILREMDGLPMADSQTIRRARLLEAVDDPSGALDVYASIPSIENLDTRAALAVRARRFQEAADLLHELLQHGRGGPNTRKDLAYALEQAGQSEEALREYAALMAAGQLDEEARVRYAWLLNTVRRHGQAWQVLSSLPRPSPDSAVLELQAKTALWSGHLSEAASLAARWRDRNPGAPEPKALLSAVAREQERRRLAALGQRESQYPSSGDPDQISADRTSLRPQNINAALLHYARLLELKPGNPAVLTELDVLLTAASHLLPAADPMVLMDLGTRLETSRQFGRAIRVYQAALRTEPEPDLLLRLGRLHRWESRPVEALAWLQRYASTRRVGKMPDSVKYEIAAANLEANRPDEALAWIKSVADAETADSSDLLLGARAASKAGRPAAAVIYLERLEGQFALSVDQLAWLAGQYRAAGRSRDALIRYEYLLNTMESPPDSLRWTIGDLRAANSDYAGALAAYGVNGAEVPEGLRLRVAYALQGVGRWDEAIALYEAHVSARPENVDGRLALARALARVGESNRAREQYQRVVAARGPSGLALELAQVNLAAEHPGDAVMWARAAVAEDGWEAQLVLATALRLAGYVAEADRLFAQLAARDREHGGTPAWRGRVAWARGRLLLAYRQFDAAVPGPEAGENRLLKGQIALERGDYIGARTSFREARSLGADSIRLNRSMNTLERALAGDVALPVAWAEDNNDLRYRELAVAARLWPTARVQTRVEVRRSELDQRATDLTVTSASVVADSLFLTSSLLATVRLGADFPADATTSIAAGAKLELKFNDESVLGIHGARDPIWRAYRPGALIRHHRILDLAAVGPSLYVNHGAAYLNKVFSNDRGVRLEVGGAGYSDDNRQVFAYGHAEFPVENALMRRSLVAPNIYVESFRHQVGSYFSPKTYVAVGLRGQTIRTSRTWRLKVEFNPHFFSEDDHSGFGLEALGEIGIRIGPLWGDLGLFFFTQESGYQTSSLFFQATLPLGHD